MFTGQPRLTSEALWLAALVTAPVDAVFLYLLCRSLPRERFRRLFWPVGIVAAVFWGLIWTWGLWSFAWDMVYHNVFPVWARYVVPPAYGVMFGGLALFFWWAGMRLRADPALSFCVFGGLVSLPGHLIGVQRGMFEKSPLLQDVSVVSALTFGVFEFIFYFGVILTLATLARAGWDRGARLKQEPARAA